MAPNPTHPAAEAEESDRSEVTPGFLAEAIAFAGCTEESGGTAESPIGDAVIQWGDAGHSGPGWYIWCSEYPEEGSTHLSPNPEPFPALLKALQHQAERDGDPLCSAGEGREASVEGKVPADSLAGGRQP